MATCPRCKGHLTEGHRCPHRRAYVIAEVLASGIVGGLIGWFILAVFDPHGMATDLDATAVIGGIVVGIGINRFLRG
jgi:hypothetical protein